MLVGTPVRRVEDPPLLTGAGRYVADIPLDGAVVVTFVTATAAHARIRSIDVEAARRSPGVLDIVTAADLDIGPMPSFSPAAPKDMPRPLLAGDVVRYVGEPVVAIVSETAAQGADAADQVDIDLDPLPAVVDPEMALQGEVLLFPATGSNVVVHADGGSDDVDVDASPVVVRATFHSARVAPCPMEPRSAASRWESDGRLTHWASCQGAHVIQAGICDVHGLAPDQVRVIVPEVGGSFGAKSRGYAEDLLLPWLARRVGRPVRWVPNRSADMVGLCHSRAQVQHVALGGRPDGVIESLDVHIVADAGAYPAGGVMLPRNTCLLSSGAYKIPKIRWELDAVLTNTTPTGAYRGAGRPEAAAMVERVVDLFAAEIGMDPVEVRRRNLLQPEDFPYEAATGVVYDSGDYVRGLDAVLVAADYEALRAEQARRREAGDVVQLGIGVVTFVDRTAAMPGGEFGSVELQADGSLLVRTGSTPYGQGHRTSWAMLVADRTGVPLDKIEVIYGDTDQLPRSGQTSGSRSVQMAGSALAMATDALVDRGRQLAADQLEAAVADVVLDVGTGQFHVVGTPARGVGWHELAVEVSVADSDELRCEAVFEGPASFPSGAYVAVVEVDTETGKVVVQRLVTVDDAGTIVNPMLALGQVHGGLGQGAAQALLEEFVYDADGNPLTSTFADYSVIGAPELPSFECSLVETPSPNNPLGAKGIAESGTIGAPPAIQNAVIDAIRHLGVAHIDMPCTPERVWQALHA